MRARRVVVYLIYLRKELGLILTIWAVLFLILQPIFLIYVLLFVSK